MRWHLPRAVGGSRRAQLLVALVVEGALCGIASAVQASIPDTKGVIHGCYSKSGGQSGSLGGVNRGGGS